MGLRTVDIIGYFAIIPSVMRNIFEQGRWREMLLLADLVVGLLSACGGGQVEPWVEEFLLEMSRQQGKVTVDFTGGTHKGEVTVELINDHNEVVVKRGDEFPLELLDETWEPGFVYVRRAQVIEYCDLLGNPVENEEGSYHYSCGVSAR